MSEEDDILAIVAALELLQTREEAAPQRSRWRNDYDDDDERLTPKRLAWKNS